MKRTETAPGRISGHFSGLGTVTKQMVVERAKELAIINGHEHFTDSDWAYAKRELLGVENFSEAGEEESVAALTRWDEDPGTSGHHVPNLEAQDEQTLAEHLVEEGVNEAEHEQMIEGSRPLREEES
jgi:hypothetical protein